MMSTSEWLFDVGRVGLEMFWRPALAWTLLAIPVYAGLRYWKTAPPLVQYHAHLALLLALPLALCLAPFVSIHTVLRAGAETTGVEVAAFEDISVPADAPLAVPDAPVSTAEGDANAGWGLLHAWGLLSVLSAVVALFLIIRMVYLAAALGRFRRGLLPVDDPAANDLLRTVAARVGVRRGVVLLTAETAATPMTFGVVRPVVVVPTSLLADADALRVTLVHELIHVRRWDYLANWIVRLLVSLFAVHPGVWLLRRRIDQYREISCDAAALVDTRVAARQYARLLLRFSPLVDLAGPTPLRMVELDSTLKKRLTAMTEHLRPDTPRDALLRRLSLPIALAVLVAPAFLAACTTEANRSETVIVSHGGADVADSEPAEARYKEQRETEVAAGMREMEALEEELALLEARGRLEGAMRVRQEQAEHQAFAAREVSAFGRLVQAEETGERDVRLLELQMDYLKREVAAAAAEMQKMEAKGEHSEGFQYELNMVRSRVQLLNSMYMRRLEQFETLKMERFTRAALEDME